MSGSNGGAVIEAKADEAKVDEQNAATCASIAGSSSDKPRAPMWRNGAYAGEFGDAYIADTELEGGQVAPSIKTLLKVVRDSVLSKRGPELTAFDPEVDFPKLERICSDLESAAERVSGVVAGGWAASAVLLALLFSTAAASHYSCTCMTLTLSAAVHRTA